jgi:hypothetical protein
MMMSMIKERGEGGVAKRWEEKEAEFLKGPSGVHSVKAIRTTKKAFSQT